ncbi:MAG: hypothetical protein HY751_14115 [Nitrospinae bacterium]|nr:hypothetical protein [Nitrospinota bacterium]
MVASCLRTGDLKEMMEMKAYMEKLMKGCCGDDGATAMENMRRMMKERGCACGSGPAEGEDKKPETGEVDCKKDKTCCA